MAYHPAASSAMWKPRNPALAARTHCDWCGQTDRAKMKVPIQRFKGLESAQPGGAPVTADVYAGAGRGAEG